MQTMQAGGTVADPTTAYLFSAPTKPIESEPQKQMAMVMLPAAIDVDVWQEDGTWTAHSAVLGVTAMADSEVALYGDFAEQVSEFWDILNERYETLGNELRQLLDLRGQTSLRFVKR
jgi:hypothetical protein